MTPEQAAQEIKIQVEATKEMLANNMISSLPRCANALKNAELKVLSGNPSPSPVGSPPGVRTGFLRDAWQMQVKPYGTFGIFGIVSGAMYAEYLEHGTSRMKGAHPYVDKITEEAMPQIENILSNIGG